MIFLLNGPPGCGKTTQIKLLTKDRDILGFSVGDIIRERIEELDEDTKERVSKGELINIETTNRLVVEQIRRIDPDSTAKIILDGYTRNIKHVDCLLRAL